ncbi:hypothetical protein OG762_05775 [Streptomyces sp. NBC_01136]|uniref:hypothetical protein n=1 Tax=unclassified Streptomyces TaxID=2593676 RepID=UPI003243DD5B|nr:hypothetical protein OG762_05775 [Streptomyces sp. NBC_01136]
MDNIEYGAGLKTRAQTVAEFFPGAQLQHVTGAGISFVLGASYTAAGTSASPSSATVPSSVADDARSADDDPCSNLSYGSRG